jgi:hypothetical protein
MFIRLLVIWIACGFWLFSILNTEPAATLVAQAPRLTAAERLTVTAHLRCVSPVIEGRSLRALNRVESTARNYVSAPARADGKLAGACGPIVLAAAAR